jgi:hypothetical protein
MEPAPCEPAWHPLTSTPSRKEFSQVIANCLPNVSALHLEGTLNLSGKRRSTRFWFRIRDIKYEHDGATWLQDD